MPIHRELRPINKIAALCARGRRMGPRRWRQCRAASPAARRSGSAHRSRGPTGSGRRSREPTTSRGLRPSATSTTTSSSISSSSTWTSDPAFSGASWTPGSLAPASPHRCREQPGRCRRPGHFPVERSYAHGRDEKRRGLPLSERFPPSCRLGRSRTRRTVGDSLAERRRGILEDVASDTTLTLVEGKGIVRADPGQ